MNRGSYIAVESLPPLTLSFNEAPIHESGKCPMSRSPRAPCPRFNEAPIHESGK